MPELHIYDVIRRPVITEKATVQADELNQYVFEVDRRANKIQIREAVEVIFEVNVTKVRTMVQPAKRGRRGRDWMMRTKEWKKAIVTLAPGDEIDLFNP
ncbi:MAG: 50S ribosomal protein L23 [Anaerolineaceae bacterium]|nr:50S ribosomal protein L23 [Anaerolineaceae bacterium]MCY3907937.1 50S ribosomal protein L23 [Anaerolineaceae bacterium]MCY3947038.1 50S ribosomal protein L23 [Anaerolineaceae bacterium]MCY4024360.1 50S ribosomal protein L23 [Anaerolineaceae bacterium]MDD9954881.1 50S ribosomal protein L23 [Anaerolineaceae bacterium]